ncbi:MAG: hypothetical protein ACOYM3_06220 [Terrimicrobiaceae bacterium]
MKISEWPASWNRTAWRNIYCSLAIAFATGSVSAPLSCGAVERPAQDQPTAPFVEPPAAPAAWEIEVSKSEPVTVGVATAGQPITRWNDAIPKSVCYTKVGKLVNIQLQWIDGTKSELWSAEGIVLIQYRNGVIEARTAFDADMWTTPDFVGTKWISLKYFLRSATHGSQKVWLYAAEIPAADKAPDVQQGIFLGPQPPAPVSQAHQKAPERIDRWEASIDAATSMPLLVRYNDYLITFSYSPPPSGSLVLPSAFQAALQDHLKRQQLINGLRSMREK